MKLTTLNPRLAMFLTGRYKSDPYGIARNGLMTVIPLGLDAATAGERLLHQEASTYDGKLNPSR